MTKIPTKTTPAAAVAASTVALLLAPVVVVVVVVAAVVAAVVAVCPLWPSFFFICLLRFFSICAVSSRTRSSSMLSLPLSKISPTKLSLASFCRATTWRLQRRYLLCTSGTNLERKEGGERRGERKRKKKKALSYVMLVPGQISATTVSHRSSNGGRKVALFSGGSAFLMFFFLSQFALDSCAMMAAILAAQLLYIRS